MFLDWGRLSLGQSNTETLRLGRNRLRGVRPVRSVSFLLEVKEVPRVRKFHWDCGVASRLVSAPFHWSFPGFDCTFRSPRSTPNRHSCCWNRPGAAEAEGFSVRPKEPVERTWDLRRVRFTLESIKNSSEVHGIVTPLT